MGGIWFGLLIGVWMVKIKVWWIVSVFYVVIKCKLNSWFLRLLISVWWLMLIAVNLYLFLWKILVNWCFIRGVVVCVIVCIWVMIILFRMIELNVFRVAVEVLVVVRVRLVRMVKVRMNLFFRFWKMSILICFLKIWFYWIWNKINNVSWLNIKCIGWVILLMVFWLILVLCVYCRIYWCDV